MKTDLELGLKVKQFLKERGVETPMQEDFVPSSLGPDLFSSRLDAIQLNFENIMHNLGLDLSNDSLIDTPRRVAEMYMKDFFSGLDYANFPKCTMIENKMNSGRPIIVKDIQVMSNCEHHFVTIDGTCTVKYIPENKIIGLSKLNRIVEFFSRRPQVQERLTLQIFHALQFLLETENVSVEMDCIHYCVKARGVRDAGSRTETSEMGGLFLK